MINLPGLEESVSKVAATVGVDQISMKSITSYP